MSTVRQSRLNDCLAILRSDSGKECLGIDLATSNTSVSGYNPQAGNLESVTFNTGEEYMPSVFAVKLIEEKMEKSTTNSWESTIGDEMEGRDDWYEIYFGRDALNMLGSPGVHFGHSLKRFFASTKMTDNDFFVTGNIYWEDRSSRKIYFVDPSYSMMCGTGNDGTTASWRIALDTIVIKMLQYIRRVAKEQLGENSVRSAIFSVPVDYTAHQISSLMSCARKVFGANVSTIPEPAAAAAGFAVQHYDDCGPYGAILDKGAGTTDCVTFEMSKSSVNDRIRLNIGLPKGNPKLGGQDDTDQLLNMYLEKCMEKFSEQINVAEINNLVPPLTPTAMTRTMHGDDGRDPNDDDDDDDDEDDYRDPLRRERDRLWLAYRDKRSKLLEIIEDAKIKLLSTENLLEKEITYESPFDPERNWKVLINREEYARRLERNVDATIEVMRRTFEAGNGRKFDFLMLIGMPFRYKYIAEKIARTCGDMFVDPEKPQIITKDIRHAVSKGCVVWQVMSQFEYEMRVSDRRTIRSARDFLPGSPSPCAAVSTLSGMLHSPTLASPLLPPPSSIVMKNHRSIGIRIQNAKWQAAMISSSSSSNNNGSSSSSNSSNSGSDGKGMKPFILKPFIPKGLDIPNTEPVTVCDIYPELLVEGKGENKHSHANNVLIDLIEVDDDTGDCYFFGSFTIGGAFFRDSWKGEGSKKWMIDNQILIDCYIDHSQLMTFDVRTKRLARTFRMRRDRSVHLIPFDPFEIGSTEKLSDFIIELEEAKSCGATGSEGGNLGSDEEIEISDDDIDDDELIKMDSRPRKNYVTKKLSERRRRLVDLTSAYVRMKIEEENKNKNSSSSSSSSNKDDGAPKKKAKENKKVKNTKMEVKDAKIGDDKTSATIVDTVMGERNNIVNCATKSEENRLVERGSLLASQPSKKRKRSPKGSNGRGDDQDKRKAKKKKTANGGDGGGGKSKNNGMSRRFAKLKQETNFILKRSAQAAAAAIEAEANAIPIRTLRKDFLPIKKQKMPANDFSNAPTKAAWRSQRQMEYNSMKHREMNEKSSDTGNTECTREEDEEDKEEEEAEQQQQQQAQQAESNKSPEEEEVRLPVSLSGLTFRELPDSDNSSESDDTESSDSESSESDSDRE